MAEQPKRRWIIFSGPIQQHATKVLMNMCCDAVNESVTHLTMLFSSDGGSIDEGFALYGLLRSLPVELTMHNVGRVGSMANVVFLAGQRRIASPHSTFLFHDLNWTYPTGQTISNTTMTEHTLLLDSARARIKTLFKLRTQLDESILESPQFFKEPRIHEATAAKAGGIVHEIDDAAAPIGGPIFNVDWSG
jgi:ATP-dependent protease ClpP protease subunit